MRTSACGKCVIAYGAGFGVVAVMAKGQLFLGSRADGMVGWVVFFESAGVNVNNALFVNNIYH